MNRLFLLALVGFVLAIDLAIPYGDDGDETSNDLKSEDADRVLKWDLEDDVGEDEHDVDRNKDGDEDFEDDDEDDNDDEEDEYEDNSLSNPLKKSSDPFRRRRSRPRRRYRPRRRIRPRRRWWRRSSRG